MKGKDKKSAKKPAKKELDTDEQLQKLGERIKQLRIAKGYTSYEYFAYDHNISRAQFGRYEQGQDLRFSSLVKICNAFGMTLDEFFNEGFD
jgi:transcriptional regulator with XRE-family HTH domain